MWRCCLQLLHLCAFQVHYILKIICSTEYVWACFFFYLESPIASHEAKYCCSDYQCETVTPGHRSFQTTRLIQDHSFFFCHAMPTDSSCFVQMSFTDFQGLVFFSLLISFRMMGDALLPLYISSNILLIKKHHKKFSGCSHSSTGHLQVRTLLVKLLGL